MLGFVWCLVVSWSAAAQVASAVWGGVDRNFHYSSQGLADAWPAGGPKKLWSRQLGDGYSAIAVEGGTAYVMYHSGSNDVLAALDAATGKTIWEYTYEAVFQNAWSDGVGPGPYAMPQVIGDRVVIASATGILQSVDKKTGKPVWSHRLYKEYLGTALDYGYSCHALPYKGTLILLVGGRNGNGLMAFDQKTGAVRWTRHSFTNAHSSPLLINVDGQDQVVALTADKVFGFDATTGDNLWNVEHSTDYGLAVTTPAWFEGNVLLVSSAYGRGSVAMQLNQKGGKTAVRELWRNTRLQCHFGTLMRLGDYAYFTSGHRGPIFLTAVEAKTGNVAWQERGFARAQIVDAGGRQILVDEDGTLALISLTPKGVEVKSKVKLLERYAWTPPVLDGTRLYVRDRKTIMALDLGR